MKTIKKIIKSAVLTLCIVILLFLMYGLYVQIVYKRIDFETSIEIINNQNEEVKLNEVYTITTFNMGFGAYDQSFSFFMDEGTMLDGTKTKGKYGKGVSKENTLKNTNGMIEDLKRFNTDFYLLQEVDVKSTRSYKVNQKEMLKDSFKSYANMFSINFDSAYLLYPVLDPHGKSLSGLMTLSKYKVDSSIRYRLPIDESFLNKFFDLDRCLSVSRFKVQDKELVIINVHFSAYDEGGVYKKLQLEFLNIILERESILGNYVIVGGDFNQDLINNLQAFPSSQQIPNWISELNNSELYNGYSIVADSRVPTVRGADIQYIKDGEKTNVYQAVIDGFIISDNITLIDVENQDLEFKNSDHNPVILSFKIE